MINTTLFFGTNSMDLNQSSIFQVDRFSIVRQQIEDIISNEELSQGYPDLKLLFHKLDEYITDLEKQSKKSNEKLEHLQRSVEAAELGIWELDLKNDTSVRSLRHDQIWGYEEPQQNWALETALKHVVPEDRQEIIDIYKHIEENGEVSHRSRVVWPDGSIHWIDVRGLVYYNEMGDPCVISGVVSDITDQKRVEETLKENQAKLNTVLEVLPVGVFIADEKGHINQTNSAVQRIWCGHVPLSNHPEEYGDYKAWWPETGEQVKPQEWGLARAVETGENSGPEEMIIECFDGKRKAILNYAKPFQHPKNSGPTGAIAVNVDITERKKIEDQVRENEQLLNTILEILPVGIAISDKNGKIIRDNAAAREVWGIPPKAESWQEYGEWIGWRPETGERIKPDEWAMSRAILYGETVKNQLVKNKRFEINDNRYFLDNAVPIRDKNREIIGGVVACFDVTDRIKSEQRLQESEEKFSKFFHDSPNFAAISLLETGEFIDVNDAFCNLTEFSREELIGHTSIELGIVTEEIRKEFISKMQKKGRIVNMEFPIRTKTGKLRTIILSYEDISIADQKLLISSGMDITVRKHFEVQITKRNNEIERLNHQLSRRTELLENVNRELEAFTYSASHDLQAPLRSISGFSEILLEDYADQVDEQGKDYLSRIYRSSDKMTQLINDLLQLSRIQRAELRRETVNISSIAKEVISELQEMEPDRKVTVNFDPDLFVDADKNLIRVVLMNLIGNAWKFTRHEDHPRIKLRKTDMDGNTVFFVRDNGAGFDNALKDKLFTPFQRLHDEKEFSGTGIGLPLVARIIRRHGGRIWGEGEEGKGATFYFTIPESDTDNDE